MSGLSALRASGRFIVRITTLPSRSTVQCFVVIGRVSGTVDSRSSVSVGRLRRGRGREPS